MMEGIRYRIKSVGRVLRQPAKYSHLLTSRAGLHALRYAIIPPRHGTINGADDKGGISARRYGSYDDYLRHQKSKLSLVNLDEYDKTFRKGLADRLKGGKWRGKAVLCLAARIGTEVKAFHDVGAFAVGIDLNPGKNNYWVLPGDFHNLAFPDDCVDAVYCNSLDHALALDKVLKEVGRVLKPTGMLLVDAQGNDLKEDNWTATAWESVDHLIKAIEGFGFKLQKRSPIDNPQPGEELRFKVAS
jgi:SAM-dependent methyltransferase